MESTYIGLVGCKEDEMEEPGLETLEPRLRGQLELFISRIEEVSGKLAVDERAIIDWNIAWEGGPKVTWVTKVESRTPSEHGCNIYLKNARPLHDTPVLVLHELVKRGVKAVLNKDD